MNCPNAAASRSMPKKSLPLDLPSSLEKPVAGASMKTRSDLSSKLYSLSTSLYGAAGIDPGLPTATRLGANDPMCSQIVDEPGPPL